MLKIHPGYWKLLVLLLCVTVPLFGYTDPGSGAMVWQVLMAGLVGGLFYVRRIIKSIRGMLRR
jgi:hypothetical protein